MRKPIGDGGLAIILNLILAVMAAGAVYVGIGVSQAGRGADIREALARVRDGVAGLLAPSAPSSRGTGAFLDGAAAQESGTEELDTVYASFLAEITAKNQREAAEKDRVTGLLARLEARLREGRFEEAARIAREMEAAARNMEGAARGKEDGAAGPSGEGQYLYLARSVARLVELAGARAVDGAEPGGEPALRALREELGLLAMEREFYRTTLRTAEEERRFAESALALQESNAQIQEMLLRMLRDQYAQSQEDLSVARAQLDTGETLATLAAKERVREGYREGIGEARDLLEQSLRIRSRDSRIAFLTEARTRYSPDSAMAALIDTLLERL
jgi:hypothetical protein